MHALVRLAVCASLLLLASYVLAQAPDHDEQKPQAAPAPDGTIRLDLPKSAWRVSAILVGTRSPLNSMRLIAAINGEDDAALAASPAAEMAGFKPDLPGLAKLPPVQPRTDYGADVIVGNKGWPLKMVLHAVHYAGPGTGTVRYSVFESLTGNIRDVRWAVPLALGDTFKGDPVVATLPTLFGVGEKGEPLPDGKAFHYASGKTLAFAEGRAFNAARFEAVVGSETAERNGLKVGDRLRIRHGQGDEHDEAWDVVGVLKSTGTQNDRAVFIPLVSFYAVPEHADALRARESMMRRHPPTATKPHQ